MTGTGPDNGLERFLHRELVLLVILGGIAAALFLVTRAAAQANRAMRRREAAVWFEQGRRELEAGRAPEAIPALRRAMAIDPDERGYRVVLADALARGGQDDGARQILLGLRERAPEDPQVNVSLARLELRRREFPAAVRYYESALYGAWPAGQEAARRQLRVELIRHLLRHGDERRALSQLLVLGANLPDDAAPQMEAAQLFFSAGDAGRALEHFRHVLRIDPGNGAALAGAGEAAFRLADYPGARRYLRAVPRPSERIQELTSLADLVVGHDPFAAKLSGQERRRRTLAGITRARARLDACLSPASPASEASRSTLRPLQAEATSLVSALARARLRHAEDALEPGVDLIARIEDAADAAGCEATDLDRALSLIGRRYASDQP